jgi:hypothetical protein
MAEPHTLAAELRDHVVELLDEHGRPGRSSATRRRPQPLPLTYPTKAPSGGIGCRPKLLAMLKLHVQVHDLRPLGASTGTSGSVPFLSVEGPPVCAQPRELDAERLKNHEI